MSDWQQAEGSRQIGNMGRVGVVSEVDLAEAVARVKIGALETDWLPWLASRAGAVRTWSPVSVGEQVLVFAPFGDLTQGIIIPGLYQDDAPAPSASADETLVIFADGSSVKHDAASSAILVDVVAAGSIVLQCGGSKLEITADGVTITGALAVEGSALTHNGKDVGEAHKHSGIQPGGGQTGAPV